MWDLVQTITLHVKHKGKVVPVHAMRAYRKHRSIAPLTVNHSSEGVVSIMHWQLYPQKSPQYPLNKRLGGSQSWSGHSGEVKCLLDLPRFKPWTIQFAAQSLYWLYYPSSVHTTYISCKWFTSTATMQNFEAMTHLMHSESVLVQSVFQKNWTNKQTKTTDM